MPLRFLRERSAELDSAGNVNPQPIVEHEKALQGRAKAIIAVGNIERLRVGEADIEAFSGCQRLVNAGDGLFAVEDANSHAKNCPVMQVLNRGKVSLEARVISGRLSAPRSSFGGLDWLGAILDLVHGVGRS